MRRLGDVQAVYIAIAVWWWDDPLPNTNKYTVRRPCTIHPLCWRSFTNPLCLAFPGNKCTLKTRPQELGVDVRKELLNFHSKYYSSNLMTLAVVGKGLCACIHTSMPSILAGPGPCTVASIRTGFLTILNKLDETNFWLYRLVRICTCWVPRVVLLMLCSNLKIFVQKD